MSTSAGLWFLLAGGCIFVLGVIFMALRERRGRGLKQTVNHFQKSRKALDHIFHTHEADRSASRNKSHREHPASGDGDGDKNHRRSA